MKMTPITKDSLLDIRFEIEREELRKVCLIKKIKNWYISIYITDDIVSSTTFEADGGSYDNGSLDLSHLKYTEQIEKLINSLLGF